jgi:hypothetical protein
MVVAPDFRDFQIVWKDYPEIVLTKEGREEVEIMILGI